MIDLSVKLGNLDLKNPIVAAGGPLAGTVEHIKDCVDAGLGGIVTKTTSTVWYLQRYPKPLYSLLDYKKDKMKPYNTPDSYFWMHREHNSCYPPLQFAKIIEEASPYAKKHNCAIIGNFSARTIEEWEEIAIAYEKAGCDALELNFCCPFPPDGLTKSELDLNIGIHYTKNPHEAVKVLKHIRSIVNIPLFVKMSPDGSNFKEVCKLFEEAGADGVTMFANNKTLRVDIETGKPNIYGFAPGTGPGLKALSMRWTAEIAGECNIAVMGNRGLSTWQDAVEFIMSGASAVQYCTPIMIRGLGYVKELLDGIEGFMKRKGYDSVNDFKDMALNQIYTNQELVDKVKPLYAKVRPDKCIGCKRCIEVCWYDALAFGQKAGVIKKNCAGCSLCSQVCPVDAIEMIERDNELEHFQAMSSAHPELAPEDFWPKGL